MPALESMSVGCVVADGEYALYELDPDGMLAVVPGRSFPHSSERTLFYGDCIAYGHDAPVSFVPASGRPLVRPVFGGIAGTKYYEELAEAATLVQQNRLGWATVPFRWSARFDGLDLNFTEAYGGVSHLLRIYGTALRQADPLGEFLHYYRIVESVDGSNGLAWLRQNIARLGTHDFGKLYVRPGKRRESRPIFAGRVDLLAKYQRRALARHKALLGQGISDVASHLYGSIRCGIAHGKRGIKTFDYGPQVEETAKEVALMKMLARMAIDFNAQPLLPKHFGDRRGRVVDFRHRRP